MGMSKVSVKHMSSGVKVVVGLSTLLFVMYVFKNSSEISQDLENQILPKRIFNSRMGEPNASTKHSFRETDECLSLPIRYNSCNTLPNFFLHKDRRKDFEDAIIHFWHMQKTGGTSMRKCLEAMYRKLNYPSPFTCMAACNGFSKVLDDVTCVTDMTYKPVVYGHNSLGVCNFFREEISDRKCSVFTIFREPYERAVSNYFYLRQNTKQNPRRRDAFELSVNDWVKKVGSITWSSFYFRDWKITTDENGRKKCSQSLNGNFNTPWPQNNHIMEVILNNLDKHLSFVGLFEDQNTTYKMLQEIYHLPFYDFCLDVHAREGSYEGLNITSQQELKSKAKETLMKDNELRELMKFDVKLYEKAKEIFSAQKTEFEKMKN